MFSVQFFIFKAGTYNGSVMDLFSKTYCKQLGFCKRYAAYQVEILIFRLGKMIVSLKGDFHPARPVYQENARACSYFSNAEDFPA